MSSLGYVSTLITAQVDGPSVNATANTSILPPAAIFTFPANYFITPGQSIRITARGRITSNTTGAAGTLVIVPQLQLINVGFTANTISLVAGAVTLPWAFDALLTCRAIGNSTVGSFITIGNFCSAAVSNTGPGTSLPLDVMLPLSAPSVIATFDTTATLKLDLQAAFSVGTASEAIVLHQYVVESLN
jgi:hypothetical protein